MSHDPTDSTPRMPLRTRLLRHDMFGDPVIGTLPPAAFVLFVGLSTRADDAGFLLWRVDSLAAALFPYQPAAKRVRDLDKNARTLTDAGLLNILACGCAELPSMETWFRTRSGDPTFVVRDFHKAHAVGLPRPRDNYPSYSSPSSVSDSASPSGSGVGTEVGPGAAESDWRAVGDLLGTRRKTA